MSIQDVRNVQDYNVITFDRKDTGNPFSTLRWIDDNLTSNLYGSRLRNKIEDRLMNHLHFPEKQRSWFKKNIQSYITAAEQLTRGRFIFTATEVMMYLVNKLDIVARPITFQQEIRFGCISLNNSQFMSGEYSLDTYKMRAIEFLSSLRILGQKGTFVKLYNYGEMHANSGISSGQRPLLLARVHTSQNDDSGTGPR